MLQENKIFSIKSFGKYTYNTFQAKACVGFIAFYAVTKYHNQYIGVIYHRFIKADCLTTWEVNTLLGYLTCLIFLPYSCLWESSKGICCRKRNNPDKGFNTRKICHFVICFHGPFNFQLVWFYNEISMTAQISATLLIFYPSLKISHVYIIYIINHFSFKKI